MSQTQYQSVAFASKVFQSLFLSDYVSFWKCGSDLVNFTNSTQNLHVNNCAIQLDFSK